MSISPLGGQERLRATGLKAAAALGANSASGAASPASPAARRPDSVTISDTARSLGSARKAVATAPAVRHDRVDALTTAIPHGPYTVDSRALAAKLLKS